MNFFYCAAVFLMAAQTHWRNVDGQGYGEDCVNRCDQNLDIVCGTNGKCTCFPTAGLVPDPNGRGCIQSYLVGPPTPTTPTTTTTTRATTTTTRATTTTTRATTTTTRATTTTTPTTTRATTTTTPTTTRATTTTTPTTTRATTTTTGPTMNSTTTSSLTTSRPPLMCSSGSGHDCSGLKKSIGGDCKLNDDCIAVRQLICRNSICDCSLGRVWFEGICQEKVIVKNCEPEDRPNACDENPSENLECDEHEYICRCPTNMEYSREAKACRLKAGENCALEFEDDLQVKVTPQEANDLCASRYCDLDQAKNIKECQCNSTTPGINYIWSSEVNEGCIVNYYEFPCTANETDTCRSNSSNSQRPGLTCIDGMCQCASGLTYSQGYCVKGTRLYGEPCDPTGKNETCKTEGGTGLSCAEIETNEYQCVCTPKLLRIRQNLKKIYAILEWNAAKKICDLKGAGVDCTRSSECSSGFCDNRKCTLMKKSAENRCSHSILLLIFTVAILKFF